MASRARRPKAETARTRHPQSIQEISPRNKNQERYLHNIDDNVITIGYGPAGTGKTYLAVYKALTHHFKKTNMMKRIVITRPVVEAGESLGYLPGTMEEKIDPYLRPIYDALYDLIGVDLTRDKIAKKHIEIAPLAFMRGRTFRDCFVILDEAQNASLEQLKMAITRIGENCKMVINGDPHQTDLSKYRTNGLNQLIDIVQNVPDLAVTHFERYDIVRSQIVVDVVEAFEYYESAHNSGD